MPNLVVVQNAAGREWVFSGPNTYNEFCDCLFGGANNGTVCVAHNCKGHDLYFNLKYLYDNRVLPKDTSLISSIRKNNQNYVGPVPDVEWYDPDGMKPKARTAFLAWHAEQRRKKAVFDFRPELIKYCRSNVDMLRRCCLRFSYTVKGLCGLNPFEHCITIASLCNLIYRSMFLKEDTIGMISRLGYRKTAQQSLVAYRWLAYVG